MTTRRKLILHIGLHKTATTFLQSVFAENLALLEAHGVKPAGVFNEAAGNHHRLLLCLKQDRDEEFYDALDVDAQTVLVSSEGFTTWLARNEAARNADFAARLQEAFDVQVVIFLRRQDYLKESVYAEVATNGYSGPIHKENHYFYEFDRLLRELEGLFGRSAVKVGVYRDDVRQNVVSKFFTLVDLPDVAPKLALPVPQRVSMSRRKVALLAEMEKANPKLVRHVRAAVSQSDAITDDGCKYQMSPEDRRAFLERFVAGNAALAERHGLTKAETAFLTGRKNAAETDWVPLTAFSSGERAVIEAARESFAAKG